ncbi:tetratricopeptide repeat protein 12 [Protopterus annectens]|uniref:tetratricopeptide repeat protein 12 n=1 Tax=Protopterus annectens TaxID=7888 RepID=UPI001CFB757E|nr:tetratricopeptide repeat protein 12 [Protopterus annectens]
MSREQEKDLNVFLKQVDKVSELVQRLNSDDAVIREEALNEADRIISATNDNDEVEGTRTKVNRTLTNTNVGLQGKALYQDVQENPNTSQDYLLALLEKDARDRAKKRKENKKLANALKRAGNEAFAKEDYELAIKYYTEGLEKIRDMQSLYTNRAQAYIKLDKYEEALNDCKWALKCNEKCIKAYAHMGRANVGLRNYTKARHCYGKMLEIDPKCKDIFKEYMDQADVAERTALHDEKAWRELHQGEETACTVKELLQKLAAPSQLPIYYAGGIRLLTSLIEDCTEQALFRTINGFSIICDNVIIQRCLQVSLSDPLEVDLCAAILHLWLVVCKGNEENQRLLITHRNVKQQLVELLLSNAPEIQRKCVSLMYQYSETEFGRRLLLNELDTVRLLQVLLDLMERSDVAATKTSAVVLRNLTMEPKLRKLIRPTFSSDVLPAFTSLLNNLRLVNQSVISTIIAAVGDIVQDESIRQELSKSRQLWEGFFAAVDEYLQLNSDEYRDILYTLLGLMVNLSVESNCTIPDIALGATIRCLSLLKSTDGGILTRTVGLLSHVLLHSSTAVEEAIRGGVVKKMIKFLKVGGPSTTRYAVRTLAICTQKSQQACEETVRSDKKFSVFMKLLLSEDEVVVGNTALCLGHCMSVPGAASSLLNTDILKLLLKNAGGDAKKNAVQQNAAIALGKLCKAETRYMAQLRELHGIEILNSCMKYIK